MRGSEPASYSVRPADKGGTGGILFPDRLPPLCFVDMEGLRRRRRSEKDLVGVLLADEAGGVEAADCCCS